ncbi:MAG: hypothetical protein PHD43_02500 [Methylococcales bacterium]|nr:hypothetical protein [Methylococcales bacterium]
MSKEIDAANVQGKHPTNVKASIMSVIGKSDSVILSGKIEHNGRYHNVYKIVAKRRIKPRQQRRPNKTRRKQRRLE